jgi:hypothetical protein
MVVGKQKVFFHQDHSDEPTLRSHMYPVEHAEVPFKTLMPVQNVTVIILQAFYGAALRRAAPERTPGPHAR